MAHSRPKPREVPVMNQTFSDMLSPVSRREEFYN
jgi:hypothetical protein